MKYSVQNIAGQANLCCTPAQERRFNNGLYWAVLDDQGTVHSLHSSEWLAKEAALKLEGSHNETRSHT